MALICEAAGAAITVTLNPAPVAVTGAETIAEFCQPCPEPLMAPWALTV